MTVPNTYPGTATPLRGLASFSEAERDVLFGRDTERDMIAKIVTAEGVRATLVFGEPGVGKTSLLRAGVMPHLRDYGVMALWCDDLQEPVASFARAAVAATRVPMTEAERPLDYLARVVSQAGSGQMFVFLMDDVDKCLGIDLTGQIAHELAELFTRVVTRSGGRGRFLFSLADARMHHLQPLELRTGSLFPPASRYRLDRLTVAAASEVLDRTLALAGVVADPELAQTACQDLAQSGAILPADLQIVARGISDERIGSAADLTMRGGARPLLARWISRAAQAAGDERKGLRVLAELAETDAAMPAAMAAENAGVEVSFAARALSALTSQGLCVRAAEGDESYEGAAYALAHEILRPRVLALAAPVRDGAQRARAVLSRAATQGTRITWQELKRLRDEGVLPSTPEELAAVSSARRFTRLIVGVAVGIPLLLLALIYVAQLGRYYLDVVPAGAGHEVVVRAGRPGLSAFFWLPHSPGFGTVVHATGLRARDLDPAFVGKVRDHDVTGSLSDSMSGRPAFLAQGLVALEPATQALIAFALDAQGEGAVSALAKAATGPDALAGLLLKLAPIARGGVEEARFVAAALADPSPSVQKAALSLALDVARRRPGAYRKELAAAIGASDAALRRLAVGAVGLMPPEARTEIVAVALASAASPEAREDLLAAFGEGDGTPASLAGAAAGILSGQDIDASLERRGWSMMDRALDLDAAAASTALGDLVGDANAPKPVRVRALDLLRERAPKESWPGLAPHVEAAVLSEDLELRTAALPLFARVSPESAAFKLVAETDTSTSMRVAMAQAWGELAQTRPDVATGALDDLIGDPDSKVRAAAASAYGRLGRVSQSKLQEMVRKESGEVREGAIWGLAASVEAGASPGAAVEGMAKPYKEKGAVRRLVARAYVRMARAKGRNIMGALLRAAREKEDPVVRALGVDGLCETYTSQRKQVARYLFDAATDESAQVRVRVAACLARFSTEETMVARVAPGLSRDADPAIRAEASRALRGLAKAGKTDKETLPVLVALVEDSVRDVRLPALEGVATLTTAPKGIAGALTVAYARADAAEKAVVLEAMQALGDDAGIRRALTDASPSVRRQAVRAAVARRLDVASVLGAATADIDASVRREALALLGDPKGPVARKDAMAALELAARDVDATVADAALEALVVGDEPKAAVARLDVLLGAPSEVVRVRAARAAGQLASTSPGLLIDLLAPLLADPSHDVRVAAIQSIARAWALTKSPADAVALLLATESDTSRRLVAVIALGMHLATDKADEARAALGPVVTGGPPLAAFWAELLSSLCQTNADIPAFVADLVP